MNKTPPEPIRAFEVDRLRVEVYASHDAMAAAAAARVAAFARERLAARGRMAAIFASATSQIRFLAALAEQSGPDWSQATIFHMDEYLGLPADHPASFRRFMREHLVARLQPGTFHPLEGDAMEPIDECERYGALLAGQPIDFCCLGIGENGHVAFNDPPVADFNDPRPVNIVRLDEACRRQQVGEGCFPDLNSVPRYALTLTVPSLMKAERLFAIVPEQRKAAAVRQALEGPVSTDCPASILRRHPAAVLFLDADSAGELAVMRENGGDTAS